MQYRAQNMLFTRVWILVDYLPVILIVSQLWSNINCQGPDYEIRTDRYVRVQRGLCAHVPCTFIVHSDIRLSRNTNGFWMTSRGETTVSVAARVNSVYATNGRFHLIGDVTRGDCSYYIEEPQKIDDGWYYFRIEDPQAQYNYANIRTYVDVTDLTDKPTISSKRLVDGKEVTMTCTSPGRCRNVTAPRISWEGVMAGARQKMYNTTYEDGTRTFHSNITFTPRKMHNNSPLSCTVSFRDSSTMERQILSVEYSPSITITVKDEGSKAIVLLSSIGAICLLLLVFLAYACWRKRQKKSRSAEAEATYTDLIRSEITDIYDQLKPVTLADTAVVGSNVGAAHDYENVHKQYRL